MSTHSRFTFLLRLLLILSAIVGCVICLVLVRLSVPSDTPTMIFGSAVCAPSQGVDCDYVLSSRWSRIGPIPVAALGMAYFAVIAAWFTAVGLPNYHGRRWHLLPLGLVTIGILASIGFMFVMGFQLPVWCTWCIAAHVVNGLVFVFIALAWPRRLRINVQATESPSHCCGTGAKAGGHHGRDARATEDCEPGSKTERAYPSNARVLAVAAACLAIVLLVLLAGYAHNARTLAWRYQRHYIAATNNIDYIEWRYGQAPVRDIPIRADDPSLGPGAAPFTVVAFSDFECSKCQAFFLSATALVERFPGKLRCVFKHYPVAAACNPHVPGSFHYFSCEAALAVEAARAVGTPRQSLDYHRALYAHMSQLDERPYEATAVQVGMDPTRFSAALRDGTGRDRLEEDITLAHELGVEATPTLFLNGRQLPTWKIVSTDKAHTLDVDKTVALWERLLGERAKR